MAILNFQVQNMAESGQVPTFIYLNTNDTIAGVQVEGYLNPIVSQGIVLSDTMMALVVTKTTPNARESQTGLYTIVNVDGVWSLQQTGIVPPALGWDMDGNALPGPGIFGTTNNQPISFRANNNEYMSFDVGTERLDIVADNFQVNSATLASVSSDQVAIQATSGLALGAVASPEVVIGNDDVGTNLVSIQAPHVLLDNIPAKTTETDVLYYNSSTKEVSFGAGGGSGDAWLLDGSNTGSGHILGLSDSNDWSIHAAGQPKISFDGTTGDVSIFGNPGGSFSAQGVSATLHSLTGSTNVTSSSGAITIDSNAGSVDIKAQGGTGDITIASDNTMTISSLSTTDITSVGILNMTCTLDSIVLTSGSVSAPGPIPAKSTFLLSEELVGGYCPNGITFVADTGDVDLNTQSGDVSLRSASAAVTIQSGTELVLTSDTNEYSITTLPSAIKDTVVYYDPMTSRLSQGLAGFTQVVSQVFDTPGAATYTPTAGMKYCWVRAQAGGGSGGGAAVGNVGSGGGSGGYAEGLYDAATIGVSQSLTIGAGGAAANNANGNAGGDTTFGALISCVGGSGGGNMTGNIGGGGGAATGGFLQAIGGQGSSGFEVAGSTYILGMGGPSNLDTTPLIASTGPDSPGAPGVLGAGGGGSLSLSSATDSGAGGNGFIYVMEFI